MTLKDYVVQLAKFIEENPESADYTVITAIDDEGNGFNPVYFGPSVGHFNDEEFYSVESIAELQEESVSDGYEPEDYPLNAVCVN